MKKAGSTHPLCCHTGVSVVEVAGCCSDCGRGSSDWVLTSPLGCPLAVSPFVTWGCCWVKAAFNLWKKKKQTKKRIFSPTSWKYCNNYSITGGVVMYVISYFHFANRSSVSKIAVCLFIGFQQWSRHIPTSRWQLASIIKASQKEEDRMLHGEVNRKLSLWWILPTNRWLETMNK